jgi:hypothetical protein
MDIMDLATAWRNTHSLSFVPITFTQVVSAAGTVFVLAALQATAGPRLAARRLEEARAMTETAIRFLREVGNTFASAAGIAQILRGLLDHQVQDRLNRRGGESPPQAYGDTAGAYVPQGFAQSFAPSAYASTSAGPSAAAHAYQHHHHHHHHNPAQAPSASPETAWGVPADLNGHAGAYGSGMLGPAAPMFQFQFGFGDALGGAPGYAVGAGAALGSGTGTVDWYGGAQGVGAMYGGGQHPAYYASAAQGPPMPLQPPCSEEYVLNALSYI